VFAWRNTNRSAATYEEEWPGIVADASGTGATTARVSVHCGFGSNWVGDFTDEYRMDLIRRQVRLWEGAGVTVDTVWLGDAMGWNTPDVVERWLLAIRREWPSIERFHLHLHDARGAALVSAYTALRTLDESCTLVLDTAIGGIGGCPYCGNGRATGMIATEDFVDMAEEMGIATGVDRRAIVEAAVVAAEVVGRTLDGKVARAGWRPRGDDLYALDMPFVETFEEAAHFRLGPSVYAGQRSPWSGPISSPQRDAVEARR
jgi:hydroxymethylglutaryl-CoA lyase